MTPKQRRFCEEYLVDNNATQAAIRAGYSKKTANEQGARLLANVSIQNYISELRKAQQERTEITADRVLQEYAKIAFADPRNFFDGNGDIRPIDDLEDNEAAVLASIETYKENIRAGEETIGEAVTKKVKFWDKLRALESIGRHLGMFEKDNSQQRPVTNVSVRPLTEEEMLAFKKVHDSEY